MTADLASAAPAPPPHQEADREFLGLAIEQARLGWAEGGVPISAALVHDGQVLAVGRNRRVQMGSAIRHAETDYIEQAGRLPASVYRRSPVTERDAATLATSALAAQAGAWGVRVHDVAPTVDAVRTVAATLAHRRHGTSGRYAARRAG